MYSGFPCSQRPTCTACHACLVNQTHAPHTTRQSGKMISVSRACAAHGLGVLGSCTKCHVCTSCPMYTISLSLPAGARCLAKPEGWPGISTMSVSTSPVSVNPRDVPKMLVCNKACQPYVRKPWLSQEERQLCKACGVTVRKMPKSTLVAGPMSWAKPHQTEMAKLLMSGGNASVIMTVSGPTHPSPAKIISDIQVRPTRYLQTMSELCAECIP